MITFFIEENICSSITSQTAMFRAWNKRAINNANSQIGSAFVFQKMHTPHSWVITVSKKNKKWYGNRWIRW